MKTEEGQTLIEIDMDMFYKSAYKQGKEDTIDKIKKEIREMKSKSNEFLNSDYVTGYISALSRLEGFLAILNEDKKPISNDNQWWLEGDCKKCKRKEYCLKECKKHKEREGKNETN